MPAQRFTHTLLKLGYLSSDLETRHNETTSRPLQLRYNFLHAKRIVDVAMPYLMNTSEETEEAVSLTLVEDTNIPRRPFHVPAHAKHRRGGWH